MFNRGAESDAIFLAKAIGIILVVAGHYQISAHDPAYWVAARKVVYTFHMPLFMGLAGYLFGKKYNFFTGGEYFLLLAGKAKRLLLPYLTLSLILLLIKSGAGNVVQLKQPVGSDFLKYLLVNPMGGFSTFLWFIYTLFVIFMFFPLLRNAVRNDLALFPAAVILSLLPLPDFFCLELAGHHLPFFTIGFLAARHPRVAIGKMHYRAGLLLFLFPVFLWFRQTSVTTGSIPDKLVGIALGYTGSMSCIALAIFLALSGERVPPAIAAAMKKVGMYSSGIYLFHTIGMAPVYFLTHRLPLGAVMSAILTCGAGLIVPMVLQKYFIDPQPVLKKYLLGTG